MKEFREEKKIVEKEILKIINNFEEKYNCYIYEINSLHEGGRNINDELKAKTKNIFIEIKFND